MVLEALIKPPFEPLHLAERKFLLLKAAFLLAITSAKQVSEMQAFLIAKAFLIFVEARTKVTLRINPAFLLKTISAFLVSSPVELEAFHPPPFQPDRVAAPYVLSCAGISLLC